MIEKILGIVRYNVVPERREIELILETRRWVKSCQLSGVGEFFAKRLPCYKITIPLQ